MTDDERPESLAAQAAAWVPPWERQQRTVDREFQAGAHRADDERPGDDDDDLDAAGEDDPAVEKEAAVGETDPPGYESEPAVAVDAVAAAGDEATEVLVGPELDVPDAVEQAVEDAAGLDEPGAPVDAPLPVDGDDAGDVFDAAADDDVSDDSEVDLPVGEWEAAELDDESDEVDPDGEPASSGPTSVAEGYAAGFGDASGTLGGGDADALREVPDPARGEPAAAGDGDSGGGARNRNGVPTQTRRPKASPLAVVGGETRTEAHELKDDAELSAALEAILLVVDEPVGELQLSQILEQSAERVARSLEDISARYTAAGHGFDLRRVAGGWRLYTRPEYAAYVERFVLDGQSVRLTQAALETLAVVAYKQPVTRSRISAIRGVNCDGVMRTLVTRGLIEECGTESETGAFLYRTTALFLEKLGLNSVDQLPPLAPFLPDDVEEVLDATG